MFVPTSAIYTAQDFEALSSAPPSTPSPCTSSGSATPFCSPPSPSRNTANTFVNVAQETLNSDRCSGYLRPRSDYAYSHPHTIHRRVPHHQDQSPTAVLAGVLGGFGVLCVVGCVIWVVWRRRLRRVRELEQTRARERKKVKAERKVTAESGPRSKEAKGSGAVGLSNLSTTAQRPRQSEGAARSPIGEVRPSSSKESLGERPAAGKPSKVLSPLSREAQLPSSPQGHSRATPHSSPQAPRAKLLQVKESPRPRPQELPRVPMQDSAGRPETPTMPMHPPLAFSDSPPGSANTRSSDSNQVPPASRYRHPRIHVGEAKAQDASDTEYFSDASTAATRQTMTNMGGTGNNPRTHRSPRVQQTVVVDLPPAYTPDPS